MLRYTAILALVAASPLAAEVVETRDDGFVSRNTASVAANPLETWLALTQPALWWSDAHTWSADAANMSLTPQADGCFCERVPGEDRDDGFSLDGSVRHMTVVQAYPLRVLRMRGGLGPLQSEPATGVLTITLKEIEGGTRLLWEYNVGGPMRFEIADIASAVDGVMAEQLAGLQNHLGALEDPDAEQPTAEPMEDEESAAEEPEAGEAEDEPTLEAQIDALADQ